VTTEDEVMRLLRRADPDHARADEVPVDGAEYLAELRTRSTAVKLIDTEPIPATPGRHQWLFVAVAAAVVGAIIAGALVQVIRTERNNTIVPAVVPTEPAVATTEPAVVPTEPAVVPTEPAVVPTEPAVAPTEPAVAPIEPAPVEILPPSDSYGGATLGEWGARWYQWVVSLPADVNPGSETTGQACGYGQNGPVFFLPIPLSGAPSSMFPYDCVVPEGTAIYVNQFAFDCSSVEAPPFFGSNEEELAACIEARANPLPSDYEVSVNGQVVDNIESYRTTTPMFTVNVPEGRAEGLSFLPPGVALMMVVANGVIIAPPPPGEYAIKVSSEGDSGYTINVTVAEPQIVGTTDTTEAPQVTEAPSVTAPPSTT
jgi:hypothetical protein